MKLLAVCLTLAIAGRAAIPLTAEGQKLHWKDGRLTLLFSNTVKGPESVAAVHAALAGAVRAWVEAAGGKVAVETGTTDDTVITADKSIVTFTDPAPFDNGLCDKRTAAACTVFSYIVETAEIQSASIAFNPSLAFSAAGLAGTFDIGAVMLHEMGHVFGLDHSGLLNAAMSPFVETITSAAAPRFTVRELGPDDVLSLLELYGGREGLATISGRAGVPGAHVVAVGANGVPARSTVTDGEGKYSMLVDPGTYTLVLEPLDGPITAGRFTQPPPATAVFPTLFWTAAGGDGLAGESITVEAGAAREGVDFNIAAGEGPDVRRIGVVQPDSTRYVFQVAVPRGASHTLSITRMPNRGAPVVRFSGDAIRPDGGARTGPDEDLVGQVVAIAADAPVGSYNLYYHDGTSGAILAGAVRVTVNPVVKTVTWADGEIDIVGSDLAPEERKTAVEGETRLAGTSVRVGDRFAALLWVSPEEIRVRIPEGVAEGAPVEVVVR